MSALPEERLVLKTVMWSGSYMSLSTFLQLHFTIPVGEEDGNRACTTDSPDEICQYRISWLTEGTDILPIPILYIVSEAIVKRDSPQRGKYQAI